MWCGTSDLGIARPSASGGVLARDGRSPRVHVVAHLAQQSGELPLLVGRKGAGEVALDVLEVRADGGADALRACGRERREGAPAIGRARKALDQARALQPVDARG